MKEVYILLLHGFIFYKMLSFLTYDINYLINIFVIQIISSTLVPIFTNFG